MLNNTLRSFKRSFLPSLLFLVLLLPLPSVAENISMNRFIPTLSRLVQGYKDLLIQQHVYPHWASNQLFHLFELHKNIQDFQNHFCLDSKKYLLSSQSCYQSLNTILYHFHILEKDLHQRLWMNMKRSSSDTLHFYQIPSSLAQQAPAFSGRQNLSEIFFLSDRLKMISLQYKRSLLFEQLLPFSLRSEITKTIHDLHFQHTFLVFLWVSDPQRVAFWESWTHIIRHFVRFLSYRADSNREGRFLVSIDQIKEWNLLWNDFLLKLTRGPHKIAREILPHILKLQVEWNQVLREIPPPAAPTKTNP